MISMQRAAWIAGSESQEPSGQTGAVPETSTLSPSRTARLKPIRPSNGEPLEILLRDPKAQGVRWARRRSTASVRSSSGVVSEIRK